LGSSNKVTILSTNIELSFCEGPFCNPQKIRLKFKYPSSEQLFLEVLVEILSQKNSIGVELKLQGIALQGC
jgi:hypothetical protein